MNTLERLLSTLGLTFQARSILSVVVTAFLTLMISGCQSDSDYEMLEGKVRFAAYEGDTSLLVWLAEDKGFFKDFGVDVTLQPYASGKRAVEMLLEGEADLATSAEFVIVKESFHHQDIRILGHIATADSTWLVGNRDAGVVTPKSLKGKRVGVTLGSTAEYFLGRFLTRHGLQLSDVEIVDLPPAEIIEKMTLAEIDAAITWQPNVHSIESSLQARAVSYPAQLEQAFFFTLSAEEDWLNNHTEHIDRILRALAAADEWASKNPQAIAQYLVERFSLGPDYAERSTQIHTWELGFSQSLLVAMDAQKRWAISKGVVNASQEPNFAAFIYPNALEAVSTNVSVIH